MSAIPFGPRKNEEESADKRLLPCTSWIKPFIAVALLLAAIMAIVINAGCVAPGYVAVLDLDLRTPD